MLDTVSIIRKIKEGSEPSFNLLYNAWISKLYSFVFHYVKSESIADDIVQETFCQLWNNRSKLDPEKSIQAFIFTISYHLIIKELRRQINNPLLSTFINYQEELITADNETTQHVEYDQFLERLEKAKKKLPPKQREIFNLNKEYNLSVKEIAEKLGISEQVVRNQLSSAVKTIREDLKQYKSLLILFFIEFLK